MKLFHLLITVFLIAGFSCKRADKDRHNTQFDLENNTQAEKQIKYSSEKENESPSTEDNLSIFKNSSDEILLFWMST